MSDTEPDLETLHITGLTLTLACEGKKKKKKPDNVCQKTHYEHQEKKETSDWVSENPGDKPVSQNHPIVRPETIWDADEDSKSSIFRTEMTPSSFLFYR